MCVCGGWALSGLLGQGQTLLGCSWLGMQTHSLLGSMCSHRHGLKDSQEPQTEQETEAWRASHQDPCPCPHLQPSPGSHSALPGLNQAASVPLPAESLATSLIRGPAPGWHRDGDDVYRCSRERRALLRQGGSAKESSKPGFTPF